MLRLSGYVDQRVFFNGLLSGIYLYDSDASCYVVEFGGGFVDVPESLLSGSHGCQGDAEWDISGQLL